MQLETIPIPLAAGQVFPLALGGTRFLVLSAPYTLAEIAFVDANGGAAGRARNVGEGYYANSPYSGLTLTNGPTAQTVIVIVASGDTGTNQLPGVVRVIDESAAKTIAGLQFYGLMRRAASGAKFSIAGVLGGLRSFALKRVSFTAGAAGLATIVTGSAAPADTPASLGVRNKYVGGTNAGASRVSGLSVGNNPTVVELPGSDPQASFYVNANVLTEMPLTNPIVIPPGYFFGIVGPAINTEVGIWFDGEEII